MDRWEPRSVTIACDDCVVRHTAACEDCLVTHLLGPEDGGPVSDAREAEVVRLLTRAGLVP